MRKKLSLLTVAAGCVIALTGCAQSGTAEHPEPGRWTTVSVDGRAVGDVWCMAGADYSGGDTFDCEWASFTTDSTHKDTLKADGEYRYVIAADGGQHRLLCINYRMPKGYHVYNCNWDGLQRG